jgi:hypothetical protein
LFPDTATNAVPDAVYDAFPDVNHLTDVRSTEGDLGIFYFLYG